MPKADRPTLVSRHCKNVTCTVVCKQTVPKEKKEGMFKNELQATEYTVSLAPLPSRTQHEFHQILQHGEGAP